MTAEAMTAKAQLSGRPRKFVRATHIAVSAGWLGLVVAMLTLGISAATASHPTFVLACYAMMTRARPGNCCVTRSANLSSSAGSRMGWTHTSLQSSRFRFDSTLSRFAILRR
ncbi:MAG TPA: hypothetical protein VNA67_04500 [Pseudonocardiaceae bacterium]|nr:hypothetical protein [Pseudonocardiaceae bacterium]